MYRTLVISTSLIAALATAGHGQVTGGPVKASDVAGTWDYRSIIRGRDTVVVTSVLTVTADGKTWTIQHGNDAPVPVRIIAVGGDSIVAEAGPYPSATRPGQTVARLRILVHYHGDTMIGAFGARFASGEAVRGKIEATRRK